MRRVAPLLCLAMAACGSSPASSGRPDFTGFATPKAPFAPLTYSVPKLSAPPVIDGELDDAVWAKAAWSSDYVDISGPTHPTPRFRCRHKMAWDDTYFYFAAELEEPHLWATYTERDSIIFHENDWEIFLDPDGDTHDYFEFEINVLNTVWDLFLVKPYRDGGPALHQWDAPGLQHAVHHVGTINDGSDTDTKWTLEVAWPWESLKQGAGTACPPKPGDRWKVNFSRVQWRTQWTGTEYVKDIDAKTGKSLPEDNWVWSPQGIVISMHYPEMLGRARSCCRPASTPKVRSPASSTDVEAADRWTPPRDRTTRSVSVHANATVAMRGIASGPRQARRRSWPRRVLAMEATPLTYVGWTQIRAHGPKLAIRPRRPHRALDVEKAARE